MVFEIEYWSRLQARGFKSPGPRRTAGCIRGAARERRGARPRRHQPQLSPWCLLRYSQTGHYSLNYGLPMSTLFQVYSGYNVSILYPKFTRKENFKWHCSGCRYSSRDSVSEHSSTPASHRSEGTGERHRMGHGRNAGAPRHATRVQGGCC